MHDFTQNISVNAGRPIFEVIILGIALLFAITALLMWLWNITITRIFKIREITFWEAFRLILICAILFGKGLNFNLGL